MWLALGRGDIVGDNSDNMAGQWRSMDEACDILGVSRRTIQRRINSGNLESKLENGRRFVLVTQVGQVRQSDSDMSQTGLVEQLQKENERLHQQLQAKDEQIKGIQDEAGQSKERADTIILQLTRQLDQSQRLLEHHQEPWYRRVFKKKRKEGDV